MLLLAGKVVHSQVKTVNGAQKDASSGEEEDRFYGRDVGVVATRVLNKYVVQRNRKLP